MKRVPYILICESHNTSISANQPLLFCGQTFRAFRPLLGDQIALKLSNSKLGCVSILGQSHRTVTQKMSCFWPNTPSMRTSHGICQHCKLTAVGSVSEEAHQTNEN